MKESNIDYTLLRYAACWEDARLLRTALNIKPSDVVASVSSAGDNPLYLLTDSPKKIIAADVNQVQLHLLSLKIAAFKQLSHEELVAFLGYRSHSDRIEAYKNIRSVLPTDAKLYWDSQLEAIEYGVVFTGKFEKYLQMFGKYVRPLIHPNEKVVELIKPKTEEEQRQFFTEEWQNWKWNLMIKLFFSKAFMSRTGRSKGMMEDVSDSGTAILQRGNDFFSSKAAQESYFIEFIFGINPLPLPPYLYPENHDIIKANLDAVELHLGTIETIPVTYGQIDAWNLSNIFEYMNMTDFGVCTKSIVSKSGSNTRMAYWNLFKERDMKTILPNLNSLPIDRSMDAGFFYRNFFAYQIK
jgi:S-adenosylmethionine-diacylglycerol 3-amino-3-carboxypropyl transferase